MTARLAIKLIEEEQIIKNYIGQGYTNNLIAEKLNKEISEVTIINYIKKKQIDKGIEIKMLFNIMLLNLV